MTGVSNLVRFGDLCVGVLIGCGKEKTFGAMVHDGAVMLNHPGAMQDDPAVMLNHPEPCRMLFSYRKLAMNGSVQISVFIRNDLGRSHCGKEIKKFLILICIDPKVIAKKEDDGDSTDDHPGATDDRHGVSEDNPDATEDNYGVSEDNPDATEDNHGVSEDHFGLPDNRFAAPYINFALT